MGPVRGHKVGVRCKVDKAQINDKLNDLSAGDPLLPPDSDLAGRKEVVPVHDDVNKQVQHNGDPGHGGVANQLGVAQQSSGTMVVGVQKGQGLLLEDQKDSVNELKVLGQVVHVVDSDNGLGPGLGVADGIEKTVINQNGDELLNKQQQKEQRQEGQKQVVELKQKSQLLGGTLSHNLATTKDDNIVDDNGGKDGGGGREGQALALGELKSLGVPTSALLRDIRENVPQVKAKRAVNGGDRECEWRRHYLKDKRALSK